MTGAAEMRRVIAHAAEKVKLASERAGMYSDTYIALAYARGVLDLLGTYITDPEPAPPAEPAPAVHGELHLLDTDGALWTSASDGGWRYLDGSLQQPVFTRAEVEDRWGPVREVWLR